MSDDSELSLRRLLGDRERPLSGDDDIFAPSQRLTWAVRNEERRTKREERRLRLSDIPYLSPAGLAGVSKHVAVLDFLDFSDSEFSDCNWT